MSLILSFSLRGRRMAQIKIRYTNLTCPALLARIGRCTSTLRFPQEIIAMLRQIIQQVRRNHALEHATIHMLSNRYRGFGAQGNASFNGFFLNLF
ncbi:MAG: DUF6391 domain-containing protein, partial [Chloroflexota bacterium]